MPGHKGGHMIPRYLKRDLYDIDVTELGYNDDLNAPKGIIRDLQESMASEYGCIKSYLLTNGATQGISTALHACAGIGDKILISADCHISVLNIMKIVKAKPVYIRRPFNGGRGFLEPCTFEDVTEAYVLNPDAKILFFTYPNYYGFCADAKRIIEFAHAKGMIVIVDEAHGAHFHYSGLLPASAVELGADIVVQSMHKTLPVLTQVGLLHVNAKELINSIESSLRIFSSTSPSYIFMVSAEYGFRYMQRSGKIELKRIIDAVKKIREFDRIKKVANDDPTRIVYDVTGTGLCGFEISKILADRYGIYAEMADLDNIVLIASVMNRNTDLKKLSTALGTLDRQEFTGSKTVVYDHSYVGRKAEKDILIYPPGTPFMLKDEIYSKEKAEYLQRVKNLGGEIVEC